ncbi:MAG: GntR family transcriptional regulator [Planctomycetota bacterium]|nr:GntR family transcriptional regulator [Planctomycetota bacterium]
MAKTAVFGATSLEEEVCERLRSHIRQAKPNQALAPGAQLAELFGVSHSTIRRAMQRLCAEGLIERTRGRGTFVVERPVQRDSDSMGTIVHVDSWDAKTNAFYARQMQGMMAQAQLASVRLETIHCPDILHGENDSLYSELARPNVAGAMLPWAPPSIVDRIRKGSPSIALVDIAHRFPASDVPCIRVDHYALGYQAVRWLGQEGAKKVALVCGYSESTAGANAANGELSLSVNLTDLSTKRYFKRHAPNIEAICQKLESTAFDGVVFDDDRTAATVLWELARAGSDLPSRAGIASHANVGEDILPPDVVRIEFDGFQAGVLAVTTLKNQMDGTRFNNVSFLIGPTIRNPKGHD